MYSKLQIVNKVSLDCRLGPTLSCLIAEKKLNSQITTSFTTTTKHFNQVSMGEGEFQKVVWMKEHVKFEKEDVEKIENGR